MERVKCFLLTPFLVNSFLGPRGADGEGGDGADPAAAEHADGAAQGVRGAGGRAGQQQHQVVPGRSGVEQDERGGVGNAQAGGVNDLHSDSVGVNCEGAGGLVRKRHRGHRVNAILSVTLISFPNSSKVVVVVVCKKNWSIRRISEAGGSGAAKFSCSCHFCF